MDQSCPRCGASLQPVDDAPPWFCGRCGLPQLRVSEDALPAAAIPSAHAGGDGTLAGDLHGEVIDWPMALRATAVAALIGIVPPSFLPGAVTGGTVSAMAVLLIPVLTLGVVSAYHRSRPRRRISPAIGVRIGAALGLTMGSLICLITGVVGFVLRYGYHSRAMDVQIGSATDTMMARLSTKGSLPPELVGFFRSPEFRAGTFIFGHFLSLLLLVLVGTICGWIAGAMLRARRQRHIQ